MTIRSIGTMLKTCPDPLRGRRDAALLAHSASPARSAARSSWRLTVADLVEGPDGYRVMIRHSKTDQEGRFR